MIIPLSTHFDGLLSRTLYGHPLQTNTIAIPRGCALVGFNVGLNASDMGLEHELRCFFFPLECCAGCVGRWFIGQKSPDLSLYGVLVSRSSWEPVLKSKVYEILDPFNTCT